MFEVFMTQRHLIGALIIFLAGLYMVVTNTHIIKRILGINVMGPGVSLFVRRRLW